MEKCNEQLCCMLTADPCELKLFEIIGEGAFGTVHKASWRGCLVAAKVIPIQAKLPSKEVDNLK